MTANIRRRRTTSAQRILDATTELLRSGERFTDLPVERIVASANVSRSTFYQHFGDKTQLVQRLTQPSKEAFFAASNAWWHRESWASWQTLAEVIARMFALAREHAAIWTAYLETAESDREFGAALRTTLDAYTTMMAARLERERAAGIVAPEVEPMPTARFIVMTTRAAIIEVLSSRDAQDDEALAQTLGRALWLAMYGEARQ